MTAQLIDQITQTNMDYFYVKIAFVGMLSIVIVIFAMVFTNIVTTLKEMLIGGGLFAAFGIFMVSMAYHRGSANLQHNLQIVESAGGKIVPIRTGTDTIWKISGDTSGDDFFVTPLKDAEFAPGTYMVTRRTTIMGQPVPDTAFFLITPNEAKELERQIAKPDGHPTVSKPSSATSPPIVQTSV